MAGRVAGNAGETAGICDVHGESGGDEVEIPARGGRASRTARVHLAAGRVWVPAPGGTPGRKGRPVVAAWVVRIWEPDPPVGVEALDWVLVTSVPTETAAAIRERRDWYGCRWLVEVFHDIATNGCGEEDRRFETAARMGACLAILSLVAVRVFPLRTALDHSPGGSASEVATADEMAVVGRVLGKKGRVRLTVREFVRGVAGLGGFLGRKGDGEPGVRTLWRGYQRLQDLLLGYHIREQDVGNR